MSEDLEYRGSGPDSPEGQVVMALIEGFRAASVSLGFDHTDPMTASLIATAAAHFAGIQYGSLIVVGCADEKGKKRFVDAMAHNIRSGINTGKSRAARIERDVFGGSVQ